jgi:VanZ family protein
MDLKKFNKKTVIIRAVLLALIIAVMAMIFGLSAQTGADSGNVSGGLTEAVLSVFGIHREEMEEAEFIRIEGAVRTAAHFSEYALLGLLCAAFASTYKIKGIFSVCYATAFSLLYAVTDEVHQIFVPGRGAQIIDVIVDTSGALCGALVLEFILILVAEYKRKVKN